MIKEQSMVFCDNCCSLALAELDEAFLCATCLFHQVHLAIGINSPADVRPLPGLFSTQKTPHTTSDDSNGKDFN